MHTDNLLTDFKPDIPDKYLFSKRFKALCDKAESIGFRDYITAHGFNQLDINIDNLFAWGIPSAFANDEDPYEAYPELQLRGFIYDMAAYAVNHGYLPETTAGMTVYHIQSTEPPVVMVDDISTVLNALMRLP